MNRKVGLPLGSSILSLFLQINFTWQLVNTDGSTALKKASDQFNYLLLPTKQTPIDKPAGRTSEKPHYIGSFYNVTSCVTSVSLSVDEHSYISSPILYIYFIPKFGFSHNPN